MSADPLWDLLTPREQECCRIAQTGVNNREIGQQMGITKDSAKQLKNSVRRKLGYRAEKYLQPPSAA